VRKLVLILWYIVITCNIAIANAQVFEKDNAATSQEVTTSGKKIIRSKLLTSKEAGRQENKPSPRIMIYFRNFKIDITPSGRVMCDFDLSIRNLTPNKINTLNAQFIWPAIKTGASFYEVPSLHERYISMTLMGKGCYTMDKVPNIVVNHCRIKGMSSEECAKAVRWVKMR